jgi:hypothetical protein
MQVRETMTLKVDSHRKEAWHTEDSAQLPHKQPWEADRAWRLVPSADHFIAVCRKACWNASHILSQSWNRPEKWMMGSFARKWGLWAGQQQSLSCFFHDNFPIALEELILDPGFLLLPSLCSLPFAPGPITHTASLHNGRVWSLLSLGGPKMPPSHW